MRAIAIWVFVLLVFLFFFRFFSDGPGPFPLGTFVGIVGVFAAFWLVPILLWQRTNGRGISYLQAGDHANAERCFQVRWWLPAQLKALARYNLGVTRLGRGALAEALSLIELADRSGRLKRMNYVYPNPPAMAALVHALQGDLMKAKQQLQEVERRSHGIPVLLGIPAELVVLCREGHTGAALKIFDARTSAIEQLSGPFRRVTFVMRAYALAQQGAEPAAVREALGAAWPLLPDRFEFLATEWPQLRDFLTTQGLSVARAAA